MAQPTYNAPASLMAMLKVYYKKNGVENLMFRNSPVVKEIKKEKVEGKSANYSAMYGRGGAVGADFIKAKANAAETAQAAEFTIVPGQIFSVYSVNSKDVLASKSERGGYMKIAGANMFAANEAFRKTLAAAFYGRGYGELCAASVATGTPNFSSDIQEMTLPTHAIMAIDIGTKLVIKKKVDSNSVQLTGTVTAINGNKVKIQADGAHPTYQVVAKDIICLDGSMDKNGNPLLPMGLGGWLPTVGKRTGSTWTGYIAEKFFGVDRSVNPDRIAGAFYDGTALPGTPGKKPYSKAIQSLMQKCRRQGSQADLIVMNDEDFMSFAEEVESNNTYFTQTSTRGKREANTGFDKFSASFSTNYIENIYDDPYCPKGVFYVLDKEYVALWSMTNTDAHDDGVAGNNPGKADPMEANNEGHENSPDGLLIDDWLNIQPGSPTQNGPAIDVALQFYGTFVLTNPSVCGVGMFKDAVPLEQD